MRQIIITLFGILICCSASSQSKILYWTDTSTQFINHRIINMVEQNNFIYALSRSQDEGFNEIRPSFSRVTTKGEKKNFTVYADAKVYEVKAIVPKPDGKIRIYGVATDQSNKFVPYLNDVSPEGKMDNTNYVMVGVPHFMGDARAVSATSCVYVKSIRGSANQLFNSFVYRLDMANNDNIQWKCILSSTFNEESSRLWILPDTSVLVLVKRYTDASFISYTSVLYKIDNSGKLIWSKEFEDYPDFSEHNISASATNIYYVNSTGDERTGTSQSNVVKLNQAGEIEKVMALENINANGVLVLKSGKVLIYGGAYKPDGNQFVEKGKVVLMSANLDKEKEREMGMLDAPDAELPGLAMTMKPTSSDFLTAIQLKDGRVVLGGRDYMPLQTHPDKILLSARANQNLMIFCDSNGLW